MSRDRYNAVIIANGAVVTNAAVEVRNEATGLIATIYDDDAGTGLANPFDAEDQADLASGKFHFHADGGRYRVRVYTGPSSSPTFEDVQRYVSLGLAGASDDTGADATGSVRTTINATAASGWTLMDGSTIGDAASGADHEGSEYYDLYANLWNNHASRKATVSGGAGASASADFAAGKTITLWDAGGCALAMVDGALLRLSGTYGGFSPDVIGEIGGAEAVSLTSVDQLPTFNVGDYMTDPGHVHIESVPVGTNAGDTGASFSAFRKVTPTDFADTPSATTGITFGDIGSGDVHSNVQPTFMVQLEIKL